jgi:N-acetyl-1-D-myo-inositol-2-amino-2-deoxy-alpha-D-glucopyranoside deacetylase
VRRIILSTVGDESSEQRRDNQGRLLFVHAHPDDETIATGGTIATLVDAGVGVTVLSCTRGERGEVIPPELKHLEGDGPALATYREGELAEAMRILGVSDHRFLGEPDARLAGQPPRRYLDSGMQWGADGAEPLDALDAASLSAAPLGEVAADIATVIQAVGATSVVSYDAHGGYGHPDHIRAHDAAKRAAEVMGVPYYAVQPDGGLRASDDLVVDVSAVLARTRDAMRAHRTQITVEGDSFALSSGPFREIARVERYRREAARAEDSYAWKDLGVAARIIACTLAGLIGIALGGIGTVNHQLVLAVGGVRLPSGVVVALVLVAALMVGLRLVFVSRIVALAAGLGILLAVAVLTVGGPGGSVLVPANLAGYAWSYGAAMIVALVLVWPRIAGAQNRPVGGAGARGGLPAAENPRRTPRDTIETGMTTKGPPPQ